MSNAEQTLRLLRELQRLDQEGAGGDGSPPRLVTPAALLEALDENNYDLAAAIVGVRSGS